jgi:hypothetical protein
MQHYTIPYVTDNIEFSETPKEIDYFKIPVESLKADGFKVSQHLISLSPKEHLSVANHLKEIDHSITESIILNIQVGKGKTTACYELMGKYATEGYMVIVLSPFKKLVEKDSIALCQKGLKVFTYDILSSENYKDTGEYLAYSIQVMTINCLLGNPGEDRYAQAAIKSNYLANIRTFCIENKMKVVMFFDEVHESIKNFHAEFIPNLYFWEQIVHKSYISSATYTPASIPVIRYIVALSGGSISVYETPRLVVENPASLHLHLVSDEYSSQNVQPLRHLAKVISNNAGKYFHILTGHKKLARELANVHERNESEIINAVCGLSPVLITGDNDEPFNESNNNLGTSFKTGIDIKEPNSLFIVIVPPLKENAEYGIFSDGLPSVLQSLARIRSRGQVHVFLFMPQKLLVNDIDATISISLEELHSLERRGYKLQNSFYNSLMEGYERSKMRRERIINRLRDIQTVSKLSIDYHYPTFSDYLVQHSENHLAKNEYAFGREISPYVIWAAINRQFTNCVLKEITHTHRRIRQVHLDKDTVNEKLQQLLTKEILDIAIAKPVGIGVEYCIAALRISGDEVLSFIINNKMMDATGLKKHTFVAQSIIN